MRDRERKSLDAQLWVQRDGMVLRACDEAGERMIERLRPRVALLTNKPVLPRDGRRLRLWWFICKLVADALNQGPVSAPWTSDLASLNIKRGAGHVDFVPLSMMERSQLGTDARWSIRERSIGYEALPDESDFLAVLDAGLFYIETELCNWFVDSLEKRKIDDVIAKYRYGLPEAAPREMERDHG